MSLPKRPHPTESPTPPQHDSDMWATIQHMDNDRPREAENNSTHE